MKKLIINFLVLTVLLSVSVMHFSTVTYAQDEPPTLVDPFATGDDDTTDAADEDAPPALTLPPAEEPAAEEPAAEETPPAEEPPAEEAPPALELPSDSGEAAAPAEATHAAADSNAYSGGTTAKSGPGLALIGLGSLIGAAALRRRKK